MTWIMVFDWAKYPSEVGIGDVNCARNYWTCFYPIQALGFRTTPSSTL